MSLTILYVTCSLINSRLPLGKSPQLWTSGLLTKQRHHFSDLPHTGFKWTLSRRDGASSLMLLHSEGSLVIIVGIILVDILWGYVSVLASFHRHEARYVLKPFILNKYKPTTSPSFLVSRPTILATTIPHVILSSISFIPATSSISIPSGNAYPVLRMSSILQSST